jgi:hypothetical protein
MNHRFAKLAAGIIATAAVVAGAGITSASASTSGDYKGAGVEISPTRIEIHLNAQGRATQTFEVEDPGQKPTVVTVGTAAFHQKDTTGKLALDAPNLPGSVTGLSWVKATPSEIKLQPGQIRKITVRIAEPKGAAPGQRYVAVEFTSNPVRRVKGQVAAHISVPGELLIDTPGALKSTASFALHLPSISWGGPVLLTATVKATGNSYVFLHSEHATDGGKAIKLPNALTLAGAQRTLSASFTPGVGLDHVSWEGQSATIIVLPGKLLLILLGVIMISGGLLLWRRSLRRHARARRHAGRPLAAGGAK